MDWHNLKVLSMYGGVLGVVIFILGLWGGYPAYGLLFGALALTGYLLYGLMVVVKKHKTISKLKNLLDDLPDERLKEIVIDHIVKQYPKPKKAKVKRLISDIKNGDYTVRKNVVIDKYEIPDKYEIDHYIKLDDGTTHLISYQSIDNYHIGDIQWTIQTPSDTIQTIKAP